MYIYRHIDIDIDIDIIMEYWNTLTEKTRHKDLK